MLHELRMQKVGILALTCIFVIMFSLSSCGPTKLLPSLSLQQSCSAGQKQPTTCQAVITNKSATNFHWVTTTTPSGIQVTPSTGTLAPGASSSTITYTISAGVCHVVVDFSDPLTGIKIEQRTLGTTPGTCCS